jgi:hypothetical protein
LYSCPAGSIYSTQPAVTTFNTVPDGAAWSYIDGTAALGVTWHPLGYNSEAWAVSNHLVGYEAPGVGRWVWKVSPGGFTPVIGPVLPLRCPAVYCCALLCPGVSLCGVVCA